MTSFFLVGRLVVISPMNGRQPPKSILMSREYRPGTQLIGLDEPGFGKVSPRRLPTAVSASALGTHVRALNRQSGASIRLIMQRSAHP